jgi:hypothetical protein
VKYLNIILVVIGVLVIVMTLRATFWDTEPTQTQPIETPTRLPSEVESPVISPTPAPAERPVTRPVGTPAAGPTSPSGQREVQGTPNRLPATAPPAPPALPAPSARRPQEPSGIPAGITQPGLFQPGQRPDTDPLLSEELEEAKRGPEEEEEEDSPSTPPVRGSAPEGQ